MIPIELQDELEKRMKKLFLNHRLSDPDNHYVGLNIFKQHLPEKESNDVSLYPYLVIKLIDGEQNNDDSHTQMMFIVGVYDDQSNYQGYRDVANIMQKIYEDLNRKPVAANRFELKYPIKWAFHDEDVYPYYFGGIETAWEIPKIIREDVEEFI